MTDEFQSKGMPLNSGISPRFTFERFVVGDCNRDAHKMATQVKAISTLYIHGSQGLGKTHLMVAIARRASSTSNVSYQLVSGEMLLYFKKATPKKCFIDKLTSNLLNADMLLIDDLHILNGHQKGLNIFNCLFHEALDRNIRVVLTGEKTPDDLVGFDSRLYLSSIWHRTACIHPPSLDTRLSILRQLKQEAPVEPPLTDAVLLAIAEMVKGNIRRIMGAYYRLSSCQQSKGRVLAPKHVAGILLENFTHT